MLGERWRHGIEGVRKRGLLAVVTFRLLPVAPFTLVNLAAGASGIRFADFLVGTVIGLLPGLVLLLGHGRPHRQDPGRTERRRYRDPGPVRRRADRAGHCGAGPAVAPAETAHERAGRPDGPRHDLEHPRRGRPQSALRPRARRRPGAAASSRHRRPPGDRFAPRPRGPCRRSVRGPAGGAGQPRHRGQDRDDGRRRVWPGADQPLADGQHRDPRLVVPRARAAAGHLQRHPDAGRAAARDRHASRPELPRAPQPGRRPAEDAGQPAHHHGGAGRFQRLAVGGLGPPQPGKGAAGLHEPSHLSVAAARCSISTASTSGRAPRWSRATPIPRPARFRIICPSSATSDSKSCRTARILRAHDHERARGSRSGRA